MNPIGIEVSHFSQRPTRNNEPISSLLDTLGGYTISYTPEVGEYMGYTMVYQ